MIDKFVLTKSAKIKSIRLMDDELSGEHMAYRIVICTTRGDIIIKGNHDLSPSVVPNKLLHELEGRCDRCDDWGAPLGCETCGLTCMGG